MVSDEELRKKRWIITGHIELNGLSERGAKQIAYELMGDCEPTVEVEEQDEIK